MYAIEKLWFLMSHLVLTTFGTSASDYDSPDSTEGEGDLDETECDSICVRDVWNRVPGLSRLASSYFRKLCEKTVVKAKELNFKYIPC